MKGIIYKAFNKINNKCYIGQTSESLNSRKSKHYSKNRDKSIFHKALKKYKKEDFEWSIICECLTEKELDEKETFFIKQHNAHYINGYGYNMTYGGEHGRGYKFSTEDKEKMSQNRMGKPSPLKGKKTGPLPLNVKLKISKALVGRKLTLEHIEKIQKANVGKKMSEFAKEKLRNRIFSKVTLEKMSKARLGKSPWNKGKKIIPTTLWLKRQEESHSKTYEIINNGNVSIIKNLSKYCRENGINQSGVKSALRNELPYRGIKIKLLK